MNLHTSCLPRSKVTFFQHVVDAGEHFGHPVKDPTSSSVRATLCFAETFLSIAASRVCGFMQSSYSLYRSGGVWLPSQRWP